MVRTVHLLQQPRSLHTYASTFTSTAPLDLSACSTWARRSDEHGTNTPMWSSLKRGSYGVGLVPLHAWKISPAIVASAPKRIVNSNAITTYGRTDPTGLPPTTTG